MFCGHAGRRFHAELSVVSRIVLAFYLLDCLYAERRTAASYLEVPAGIGREVPVLSKLLSRCCGAGLACLRSGCCCRCCSPASGR